MDNKELLTDEQVSQFITKGYLVLKNDLAPELHQEVLEQLHQVWQEEGNPGNNTLPRIPKIQKFFCYPYGQGRSY